jgi:succinate dehydrogenase / fumarate reductase flavoprotein subunit
MEVGPTCHYAMGGVRVDAETAATTLEGLYAAGEVAGGMHGANRLGGNSLSDLLVFGRRAGAAAASFAAQQSANPKADGRQLRRAVDELAAPFDRPPGEDAYRLHADLQATMQKLVGIFRTAADLDEAIQALGGLRERWKRVRVEGTPAYNPGWNLYFELRNMLVCAEAVARSALQRTESRGAHARIDHPGLDAEWGTRNSTVTSDGEKMHVTTTPLPEMPDELRRLIKT